MAPIRVDVEMARWHLARAGYAALQLGAELVRLRAAADWLISSSWATARIRLIADALLQHGTLSGEQIAALKELNDGNEKNMLYR